MSRVRYVRNIIGGLLLLYGVFIMAYYAWVSVNMWQAGRNAERFLDLMVEQKWEEAEAIATAHSYADDPAKREAHRRAWIERMRGLKEQGYYLAGYDSVRAFYDDACVCGGHANLTFRDGERTVTYRSVFTGGLPDIGQLCPLSAQGESIETNGWKAMACSGG
ncbi:hypothetical protein ACP26L_31610 [Paenibacillus sp. S-38]|uniref:hypothetical protein n=1 Tax=Paenibacillus sp. S-38 TaxID=3416710 RepID=UPI003CF21BBD